VGSRRNYGSVVTDYLAILTGADGQCGCPILCPGTSIKCGVNKTFLPDELEGKISKEELNSLTSEVFT
jgi:hypothetical protein